MKMSDFLTKLEQINEAKGTDISTNDPYQYLKAKFDKSNLWVYLPKLDFPGNVRYIIVGDDQKDEKWKGWHAISLHTTGASAEDVAAARETARSFSKKRKKYLLTPENSKKEESVGLNIHKEIQIVESILNEGNKKLDLSAEVEAEYNLAELGKYTVVKDREFTYPDLLEFLIDVIKRNPNANK